MLRNLWLQGTVFGLLLLLPACGARQVPQRKAHKRTHHVVRKDADLWEAKLSDIPVPLGATPIEHKPGAQKLNDSPQEILYFDSTLSSYEAVTFYEQEMERFGWRLLGAFDGNEELRIFEKPYKIAVITVRERHSKRKKRIRISVMVGEKHA